MKIPLPNRKAMEPGSGELICPEIYYYLASTPFTFKKLMYVTNKLVYICHHVGDMIFKWNEFSREKKGFGGMNE